MVEGEKLFQTSAIQRKRLENGRPLPRMGKGSLLNDGQNHGNVKDTITITMCASGR
jgi:hypothetical protein